MEGTATSQPAKQLQVENLADHDLKHFIRFADPLFKDIVYWINPVYGPAEAPKPALLRQSESASAKINGILVRACPQMINHVARFYMPRPSPQTEESVLRVTHIVSPDTHFAEYTLAVSAGSGAVYQEKYYSASAKRIFSGMVVVATQVPALDKEEILGTVMALGGQYRQKMMPDVTHVLMIKDTGPKYEYITKHPQLGIKPILVHWLNETMNMVQSVPQDPYLFPNPPMLAGHVMRDQGQAQNSDIAVPAGNTQTANAYELPKPATQFLKGYFVAVDSQLRSMLSRGAIEQLNQRLSEAGAVSAQVGGEEDPDSLSYDWKAVDVLICHNRSGYDYSKASRLGKVVGSFVWLYHLFFTEKLVPPTKRLLHYPVPDTAARGMAGLVITTSHYTGASKEYLKKLILAMGAEYTPNMTRRNTHLITAMPEGLKYARAMDWDIHIVNHIWLEQSFQRWKALSVSHASFTYFPNLPILNSMVGSTEVNVSKLPRWVDAPAGDSVAESSDLDILSDSELDSEVHVDARSVPGDASSSAVRTDQGHVYPEPNDDNDDAVVANGDNSEDDDDSNGIPESSDELDANGTKDRQAESDTLVVGKVRHSSRRAAMAASKNLGQMMKAANIFETEMKREKSYRRSAKRTLASEAANGESGSQTDGAKRARTTTHRQKQIVRIMFTQVRPSPAEQQRIIAMGGEIVDSTELATHLVAKKVGKTAKMLEAVASGSIAIVGREWMDDSLERGRWIPVGPTADKGCEYGETEKYQLVDEAAEARWNFVLRDSLQRAHKHRMFDGVTIFITPHTVPAVNVLRPLIERAGGQAVERLTKAQLKTLINQSIHISKSKKEDDERIPPLLVISCSEDKDMWAQFELSKEKRMPIYGSEVLLVGLLRQRLLRSSTEFLCRGR
ncbi:hypothetical protein DL89DRAFT_290618 [Linderina pennispora]|uniref:BRCT domain-containing protein n=1 Tax=Linderina pennispora TaxID=61395 RepID=A0A1Y1WHS4_9FUNG|nr:uncharacterized protein DL89DRAFT_290618 [Linderina pennispora]ORX72786.1 hypothetical protein DL89DRAFT_290618 [Linderina pennispora]